jgi:hypothetical protein
MKKKPKKICCGPQRYLSFENWLSSKKSLAIPDIEGVRFRIAKQQDFHIEYSFIILETYILCILCQNQQCLLPELVPEPWPVVPCKTSSLSQAVRCTSPASRSTTSTLRPAGQWTSRLLSLHFARCLDKPKDHRSRINLVFQLAPEKLGRFETKAWNFFSVLKRAIFSNSAQSQVRPISRGL